MNRQARRAMKPPAGGAPDPGYALLRSAIAAAEGDTAATAGLAPAARLTAEAGRTFAMRHIFLTVSLLRRVAEAEDRPAVEILDEMWEGTAAWR